MTATGTSASTHGGALKSDPLVRQAIDAIVERVGAHSAAITGVLPPNPDLKVDYETLLERCAAVKGRGLLYPYLGSGLGNGPLVELEDGSVKYDMITGIGVHFFGHSHPELVRAAIEGGLEDTAKHGNLQSGFGAYEFGEKLLDHAKKGSRLAHAFVTTSGAVANESALKVCYQKRAPASRVIAFSHCFMGRTVTMAQIGDSAGGRDGIPLSTQVDYMPFWSDEAVATFGSGEKFTDACVAHLDELVARYPGQHACFIFELVQGEGGFNTAPREFFVALMERCREHGIPIWDDEIQTFGRTERMFAYDMLELGEYVDVFCVGKMTQACATLWTEAMNPRGGLLSGTFTGSATDFTVGSRILDLLAEGDHYGANGAFAKHHGAFRERMGALIAKHPDWFPPTAGCRELVGGVGGMMKLTPFGGDKAKVWSACKACYDEGLVLFYCGHGPFHIRMLPPLPVMSEAHWDGVFEVLERGLAKA